MVVASSCEAQRNGTADAAVHVRTQKTASSRASAARHGDFMNELLVVW
jgi:hypothetical protein